MENENPGLVHCGSYLAKIFKLIIKKDYLKAIRRWWDSKLSSSGLSGSRSSQRLKYFLLNSSNKFYWENNRNNFFLNYRLQYEKFCDLSFSWTTRFLSCWFPEHEINKHSLHILINLIINLSFQDIFLFFCFPGWYLSGVNLILRSCFRVTTFSKVTLIIFCRT